MAEEITNATEMAGLNKKEISFMKVLEEAKIPHEMVRKKRGGGNRTVIVRMLVLSRPFLINIAFTLEFYSPLFSIRCFPAPETYCIRGKHSRKYGIVFVVQFHPFDSNHTLFPYFSFL